MYLAIMEGQMIVTGTQTTMIVLGILLGLSVVLLVVVITGWACSCWIMKKKERKLILQRFAIFSQYNLIAYIDDTFRMHASLSE